MLASHLLAEVIYSDSLNLHSSLLLLAVRVFQFYYVFPLIKLICITCLVLYYNVLLLFLFIFVISMTPDQKKSRKKNVKPLQTSPNSFSFSTSIIFSLNPVSTKFQPHPNIFEGSLHHLKRDKISKLTIQHLPFTFLIN